MYALMHARAHIRRLAMLAGMYVCSTYVSSFVNSCARESLHPVMGARGGFSCRAPTRRGPLRTDNGKSVQKFRGQID